MENHISQLLQVPGEQADLIKQSVVSKTISNLADFERKILELKYKGKPFSAMTIQERTLWTKSLVIKIGVITGWEIPQNEAFNVLVDQFEKKLFESFPNVNSEEIEFAFRSSSYEVKDWGKNLNLSLIDEVMRPYLSARAELSRLEEQQKSKLMLPETAEDISDEGMDKFRDATEELVAKGNYPVELIPPMLYDWMDKNGNILFGKEDKLKYLERATLVRHTAIAHAFEKNPHSLETKAALAEFNEMRRTKNYSQSEHDKIIELSKKMVVYDMMKTKLSVKK